MQALQLTRKGLVLRTDYPIPEPGAGQALIRVSHAGICTTDLEMVAGYMQGEPLVLGHEFVGIVESCPADGQWVGKRVVGEINIGCGNCAGCREHRFNHCPRRSCLGILRCDGAFAEYLVLPTINLHEVPADMADNVAVFTEPVAAALRLQAQLPLSDRHRVAVIGAGKLGLLIALTLQGTGCQLEVLGRHAHQLAILAPHGIRTIEVPRGAERELAEEMRHRFDVVVECAASASAYELALALTRPLGTLILKSTKAVAGQLDLNTVVVNEIRVLGSRCGPFAPALVWLRQAVQAGLFPVHALIEDTVPLAQGRTAFNRARRAGALKILLQS